MNMRIELRDGESIAHYRRGDCRANYPARCLGGPGIYEITRVGDLPRKVRPILFPAPHGSAQPMLVCECGFTYSGFDPKIFTIKNCESCGAEFGELVTAKAVQEMLEERGK